MADILSTVMDWRGLTIKGLAFTYGLINLTYFIGLGILDGVLLGKPSDKTKKELAAGAYLVDQGNVVGVSD